MYFFLNFTATEISHLALKKEIHYTYKAKINPIQTCMSNKTRMNIHTFLNVIVIYYLLTKTRHNIFWKTKQFPTSVISSRACTINHNRKSNV